MLKDLILALSTANLCFILTWNELIKASIRRFNTCAAVIINVILLGALFWILITLARRYGGQRAVRVAQLLFPLVLLLPLNGIITILFPHIAPFNTIIILGLAVCLMGLFEVAPWHRYVLSGATFVVTVLSPFFLFSMTQASWSLINTTSKPAVRPVTGGSQSNKRVLWLLFDEMDQYLAFSQRPATLNLGELDRLRGESIYATNVFPPADSTSVSVPAMISGKLISQAEVVNRHKLLVTFADSGKPVNWASEPNLFSDAREAGVNTTLIGWFLPYCSMIGESLTNCSWIDAEATTLGQTISRQLQDLFGLVPIVSAYVGASSPVRGKEDRVKAMEVYLDTLEAAKKAIADPAFGVLLVHWSVPHPPSIYDRQNDRFEIDGNSSYLDNLQLADRALGELRRAMEDAGTWQDTFVLVTSDHCWRPEIWRSTGLWTSEDGRITKADRDHRVPFILKLEGQQGGVTYEHEFNNVLTRYLILGLLRGELSSAESVTLWLDEHRSIGESPYQFNLAN